uniref:C-type lectin domain-containing protein n=1 Tax=Panagrellus redivivus TaxID=6233 RepID=A0A7E4VBU3_PANRE
MISQLNCRCPAGWTQLVVNNVVFYADCFYYQFSINFPGCDGSTILAVANTPARLDFITQLASNWTTVPTSEINVGLVRYDANSPWIWEDGEAYTAFPVFAQTPSETNTYGYLAKTNNYNWQLLSDDSLNTRQYVCQRRACDANHLCDLSI